MAEVLGEFDNEYPSSPFSCCRRISFEDYVREGSEQTHVELEKLLDFVENDPKVYYNAIRKRQRDELKLLPFLKVKVMSAVQGEANYLESYFSDDECKKKLDSWKGDMIAAYDFGQGAIGSRKRFSKRLAAKRKVNECNKLKMTTSTCTITPPPPPPPPPPVFPLENPGRKMDDQNDEDIENRNPTETFANIPSSKAIHEEYFRFLRNISGRVDQSTIEKNNDVDKQSKPSKMKSTRKSQSNLPKNLCDEIIGARMKLRCINTDNSPGMTPYQLSKNRREARRTPEDYAIFNVALAHKFRNARSPSPSGHFDSSSSFSDSPY